MSGGVEERAVPGGREAAQAGVEVAVVISVAERADRVETVYEECRAAFAGTAYDPEFVLVAEPWAAGLLEPFRIRRARGERVRLLRAGQTVGETVLIRSGVAKTWADVVITLPAYPRVDAAVLPVMVDQVLSGADMAVAKRWPRHDSTTNRFQTRAFHALLGRLTGSNLTDVACGVRAMRPELIERLPAYGDFGRFLPMLAARQGYRVIEVESEQHELDRPARVYSPSVYLRRLLDVFGLYFLTRFMEKPLRFFGLVGGALAGAGGLILIVLTVQRLQGQSMADRPMLLLGVLLLVLGAQAIALGLVGEIIVYLQAGRRKPYRLLEVGEGGSSRKDPPGK
jgi:hypothetical protein